VVLIPKVRILQVSEICPGCSYLFSKIYSYKPVSTPPPQIYSVKDSETPNSQTQGPVQFLSVRWHAYTTYAILLPIMWKSSSAKKESPGAKSSLSCMILFLCRCSESPPFSHSNSSIQIFIFVIWVMISMTTDGIITRSFGRWFLLTQKSKTS
jgi:hypothetical protein